MGKINVLEKHVAELIAAGEVVERPASVVKELAENAVDAEASAITVEIRNGGVRMIRVTDNGYGIAREDVPLAFLRHATSKITGGDDLDNIGTLGFRGEALASVAAVAHVEMLTRAEGELAGTRYLVDGEGEQPCEDAGCAQGTVLTVSDLFYNTPARLKFLKKDVSEGNAVAAVVDRIALSHPEISFRFIRDGRELLHTPGDGVLKSAVYAVQGKAFTEGLMPVEYSLNGVGVTGFVTKPSASRPNRSMQYFFLNGRFVKSRTVMVAMEEAFKGSMMVSKFPACVLHLHVPLDAVDVNVHPSKIEVRFINEKPIFDAVYHGIKSSLNKNDTPNEMSFPHPAQPVYRDQEMRQQQLEMIPSKPEIHQAVEQKQVSASVVQRQYCVNDSGAACFSASKAYEEPVVSAPTSSGEVSDIPPAAVEHAALQEQPVPVEPKPFFEDTGTEEKLVGEVFSTYVILERGDELIFIDKHAAHERILYEKLKAGEGKAEAARQMLLEPVTVTLDKEEYSAVLESLDLLEKAGFEAEDFGCGTILVRSIPVVLEGGDIASAVMETAGYLASCKNDVTTEKINWLYHNIACRAAIKAGDHMSRGELIELVKRVEQEDIRYCPHGRPVHIILRKKDLEKQFGRIQ